MSHNNEPLCSWVVRFSGDGCGAMHCRIIDVMTGECWTLPNAWALYFEIRRHATRSSEGALDEAHRSS